MPCIYMARLVIETLKGFKNTVKYKKVVTKNIEGAKRYREIIKQSNGIVPVPSIIIDGRLAFATIPGKQELAQFLESVIHGQVSKGEKT